MALHTGGREISLVWRRSAAWPGESLAGHRERCCAGILSHCRCGRRDTFLDSSFDGMCLGRHHLKTSFPFLRRTVASRFEPFKLKVVVSRRGLLTAAIFFAAL